MTQQGPVKVALAGATGNIGLPILNALLGANHQVVVLTREGSNNTSKLPKSSNITVKEVDYASIESLRPALEGVKVVVSTLATESIGAQTPLIDASIAAGVERFLPSEFGSDTFNDYTSKLPVFQGKVGTRRYLQEKVKENPNFSYTCLITGPFFDWGLKMGFILNPAKASGNVFDGGDVPFSTTTLKGIGQAVVGVISHLADTKNRAVYVRDATVTQNQLIKYAKEKNPDAKWDITEKDTKEQYEWSQAELKKEGGNIGAAMVGFITTSIFGGKEKGGDFEGRDDSVILGVKKHSDEEIKSIVWEQM
jgi:hypothetical protein